MNDNKKLDSMLAEALEILDHAEIATVEGGYIWGPSCPGYPSGDGDQLFIPFGPGPIILC